MGVLGAVVVLLVNPLPAPAHAAPVPVTEVLARAVHDQGIPGAVAVVRAGSDVVRHVAGYSDVATRAGFTPDSHVRAASITKTFVAAAVLQLVGEGRVDLDASVESLLPGRIRAPGVDADAITVRHLLRHQSGLPEYFDAATPTPSEPLTADQILGLALDKPSEFTPGTQMRYTNTNYTIAGLIIEAVTGQPAADEIARRIMVPLGLDGTYFPALGDTGLRVPFAHGYELVDGRQTDVTTFHGSAAGLSGSLISTGEDMAAFISALLDGRVVGPAQLEQMKDTIAWPDRGPRYSYGLGLVGLTLPCGVTVWGHGGDIEGYHSLMVKQPGGAAVSVTFTQGSARENDPREALAEAVFCSAPDQFSA